MKKEVTIEMHFYLHFNNYCSKEPLRIPLRDYGYHIILINLFDTCCKKSRVYQCTLDAGINLILSQESVGRMAKSRIFFYAFFTYASLFALKSHTICHHPFQMPGFCAEENTFTVQRKL